jgi:hypothetical protein
MCRPWEYCGLEHLFVVSFTVTALLILMKKRTLNRFSEALPETSRVLGKPGYIIKA